MALIASALVDRPDIAVECNEAGRYFNTRLMAPNAWEVCVDPSLIDEAAAMFEAIEGGAGRRAVEIDRHERLVSSDGRAYFITRPDWNSDITWVAVDDSPTFAVYQRLFERLAIPQRFAGVVTGNPRLYGAYFVVRSKCDSTNLHTDFEAEALSDCFTVMTPLHEYASKEQFQLSYVAVEAHAAPGEAMKAEMDAHGHLRRYEYKRGKAIVFGSHFLHGTEAGRSHEAEERPHVYLSFVFGSDDERRWPDLRPSLDWSQSRLLMHPNGTLGLSMLGRRLAQESREV